MGKFNLTKDSLTEFKGMTLPYFLSKIPLTALITRPNLAFRQKE